MGRLHYLSVLTCVWTLGLPSRSTSSGTRNEYDLLRRYTYRRMPLPSTYTSCIVFLKLNRVLRVSRIGRELISKSGTSEARLLKVETPPASLLPLCAAA